MVNPFKKRQQKKAAAAAASASASAATQAALTSPPPTDYATFPSTSQLPPRPGIFIASAPALPRSPSYSRQRKESNTAAATQDRIPDASGMAGLQPSSSQQQNLDLVLPPASDYRQSLIMPHLTRRFTLLRAPDGSLVSPEAMRAHLRAQRARARATNHATGRPNDIHFLTEDEENAIIDQLKTQARAEGRDFDLERSASSTALDSWRSGYAAGTDGFGSWGPVSSNNANKLSSLTESFGDFSSSTHEELSSSSAWSPTRKPGGSSFTGRSTERDHAYFRTVKRERNNSRPDNALPSPLKSDSALVSSQDATLASTSVDLNQQSHDTARPSAKDGQDSPMPGAFATFRDGDTTQRFSPVEQNAKSPDADPRPAILKSSQDTNLLTTLSPEAFKRVSTALDEVFGLMASERSPSPNTRAKPTADSNNGRRRLSDGSDAHSFISAVSNVRALDAERDQQHAGDENETADRTITATGPSLTAGHEQQGRLAVPSPLPGPLPGSLPKAAQFDMPESQTMRQMPSLATSESVQTLKDTSVDAEATPAGPKFQPEADAVQHLSSADSLLTLPSERSSAATARNAHPASLRVISTASTVEAPELVREDAGTGQDADAQLPARDQRSVDDAEYQPAVVSSSRPPVARPDRTPEMNNTGFFASPARSTLSRGDSLVSSGSVRSSLTGPSAAYHGTHSRKSSADKLALARSMAPPPHLREQPSLSSVRRNFRRHNRSATGSSEGSLLGGHASRRSSGAMSPPPMLSRSARSPNYFPLPSSGVSMHDYASGFKPPSAVTPAAAAALQSMTGQVNYSTQPIQSSVMEASTALRSAQNKRSSASTNQSAPSPYVPSFAAFASGSDRAAVTSSPETGGTSNSLHNRNASLTNNQPPVQTQSTGTTVADEGMVPSILAPRPAPLPELASQPAERANQSGLMPHPPLHPEQADKWRAIYGSKAADAASLRASAEDVTTADPNEEEDLWAKMASASESDKVERPVSSFPSGIAEERLADAGISFDQIADLQDRLIQTANGREEVPPVPRIAADSRVQTQDQQQKFAEAKSLGLASPNMVFNSGSGWSKPTEKVQTQSAKAFAGSIDTGPIRKSLSNDVSPNPPVSPRAVMYDVTMSHRPTSPPLHSRNGSLGGLPSLLELNGSVGHRHRESFSLSQAVDQASRLPRHPALNEALIAEDSELSIDQESQYATAAHPVQDHPFNAGYTSPSMLPADLRSGDSFSFARKPSTVGVGDSPRHQGQPFPPEDVWDRYGPQQGGATPDLFNNSVSPDISYHANDPTSLHDDIAAQTSAATRALKGTDDGSVPTPPFRTKSISRGKSFRKVSKQISTPQLISTTQKLDHATQISPPPAETSRTSSRSGKRSLRSPGWGSIGYTGRDGSQSHTKASPSGPAAMGGFGKNSLSFHRRRSSSFGHEASPNESFETPDSQVGSALASAEQSSGDRVAGVHPNHPYMNGGANGGSLSRLFSKIKGRKNDQAYGGATIEPFPPELSAAARASELSSQLPQQQPTTPEMPSLTPVERQTPWTVPRMPPTPSSSERGSSLRSPSSQYPLIDSTSLPRLRTKKRTPIVLKPESEVILPGDPGYIATAVIGRSPQQRAQEFSDQQSERETIEQATQSADSAIVPSSDFSGEVGPEKTTDTTLERTIERMDYLQGGNLDTLAPPAGIAALDNDEAVTPRAASPMPASAPVAAALTGAAADQQPADGDDAINDAADTTIPASNTLSTSAEPSIAKQESQTAAPAHTVDARKSLRDTIVRRTLIIPAGIDFGDQRRSLFGSSRKSRRFAGIEDQPVPNSGDTSKSFNLGSPAMINKAALPEPEHTQEDQLQNEDAEQQRQPQQVEGMATLSSNQTLHPDALSRSSRASRVESSYAGSLYDMYINGAGDGEDNVELGSPGSDLQGLPAGGRSMADRASRMPETRRHIEVTERADGSVVWQVIAGLADRGSVYSDFDPRSSRHLSDASGSGSAAAAGASGEDATEEEELLSGAPPFRTAAGLTDDDSRSFFTRPRAGGVKVQQHPAAFSLDTTQPLPKSAHANNGVRQDVFEIANPPTTDRLDTDPSSTSTTAPNGAAPSSTRIVYHNDAQLASLLDVLAKGKDSAKFQFHIGPNRASSMLGEEGRQLSPADAARDGSFEEQQRASSIWSKTDGVLDADDIESHRSRVEAEIYTLLNRHALAGRDA